MQYKKYIDNNQTGFYNVLDIIDNGKDKAFLVSIMADRAASMAGTNKVLTITKENNLKRKEA